MTAYATTGPEPAPCNVGHPFRMSIPAQPSGDGTTMRTMSARRRAEAQLGGEVSYGPKSYEDENEEQQADDKENDERVRIRPVDQVP
jgi:hypothetical protein